MKPIMTLAVVCFLCFALPLVSQTQIPDTEKRRLGHGMPGDVPGYAQKLSMHSSAANGGRIIWKTGSGNLLDRYICYNDAEDPIKFSILIDQDVKMLQNVKLTLSVWDVDESSGEVDVVYVNGQFIGTLHGANDSWSVNNYAIDPSILVGGTKNNPGINDVTVDLTVEGWCVTVDWGAISADGGDFSITEFLPGLNKLTPPKTPDIHFKFSSDVDETTVSAATVKLQYRNLTGALDDVACTYTVAGDILAVKPTGALNDGVRYSVAVTGGATGVKSKKGAELSGSPSYDFATIPDLTVEGPAEGEQGAWPIQVVRNQKQVREKPTVMRVYTNKWTKWIDVHPSAHLETLPVTVTVKDEANNEITSQQIDAQRMDLRDTPAKRKEGTNSINVFYDWLSTLADGAHTISVELEPVDQVASPPVTFKKAVPVVMKKGKVLKVVYQYVLAEGWAGGVPAADRARMDALMANCKTFFRDNFPVKDVEVTKGPDLDLTAALASYTWRSPRAFPGVAVAAARPFRDTVKNILLTMDAWRNKASGTAFVALIPSNFGQRSVDSGWINERVYTGVSYDIGNGPVPEDNKLIMLRDAGTSPGSGANATTVAHEFGHNYSLSTQNFSGAPHTRDSMPTEGYWVTKKLNKSMTEGNTEAAAHKSLMSVSIQPENERWICDYDYNELYDNVPAGTAAKAPQSTGPHLFISGGYDLNNKFYLSPVWEGEYTATTYPSQGDMTLLLLNAAGTQLASYPFPSTTAMFDDGSTVTLTSFGFFVPSPANLATVRIMKGATTLKEIKKSAHAPALTISSPQSGAVWRGAQTINWSGTDADNEKLLYMVSYSYDGGVSWMSLAANSEGTTLPINTEQLPSGQNCMIRVTATDGTLNFTTKDVALKVDNGLALGLFTPGVEAQNVPVGARIEAVFNTPVAASQVGGEALVLKEAFAGTTVPGTVNYSYEGKTISFVPASALKSSTRYTATVKGGITDELGNRLASDAQWSFMTASDNADLSILTTSPGPASTNNPVNGAVTVTFNKDLNGSTVNAASFTLYDNVAKAAVPGSVSYNALQKSATFVPSVSMKKMNDYKVTLSTGIKSADAKALAQNYEYFFMTGSDSTSGVRLMGRYRETRIDDDGDNLYNWLAIDVDVSATASGTYSINGKLADKNNTEIVWASSNNQYLTEGITTIRLRFDGRIINAYRINGPYYLNDLQIYSTSNTDKSDWVASAYATRAYAYSEFQTSLIPVIAGFTPTDGANDVPPNATVTATFTRQMDKSSIDSNSFYVVDRMNRMLPGAIAYDTASLTATFTPARAFNRDSVYRAAVTTSVRDVSGTRLLKQYNWSFTIASTAVSTSGAVGSLYTYPNPFPHASLPQGGMYFTYMLDAGGGRVSIRIYTITGDLVKEIAGGAAPVNRGFNQVYWNGLNDAGKTLASGTYIYLLQYVDASGGEHKEKGKFTVLKKGGE